MYNSKSKKMMQPLVVVLCLVGLILTISPIHAQPIINEVVNTEVKGQGESSHSTSPSALPFSLYIPIVQSCFHVFPLQPVSSADLNPLCALQFTGSQGPSNFLTTVNHGEAATYSTDLPQAELTLALTQLTVSPPDRTLISTQKIKVSAMTYITETGEVFNSASVQTSDPLAARIAWVIQKALQNKNQTNPDWFPVNMLARLYTAPDRSAPNTSIFETPCVDYVTPGTFYLYAYPYDFVAGDVTARGGNIWLRLLFARCPLLDGRYIRLSDFWHELVVSQDPRFDEIDLKAEALVSPKTYHVSNLQYRGANGTIQLVGATVIAIAVGSVILIIIFPEVGAGWYLITAASSLQDTDKH